jgi:hypothetical protein
VYASGPRLAVGSCLGLRGKGSCGIWSVTKKQTTAPVRWLRVRYEFASTIWRVNSLERLVSELDMDAKNWDLPPRLYALSPAADLLAIHPELGRTLSLSLEKDPGALTAIEQEGNPSAEELEEFLAGIGWAPEVVGAAVVLERLINEPSEDVRITAAVLRDGLHQCAIRFRRYDFDDSVLYGADLVPQLIEALAATLAD